ncbi:TPA: hypothetical protein L9K97_005094 [Klebsiella pneumoniae]|nr:hypothetical protein [Klebsiella pneumoniae]
MSELILEKTAVHAFSLMMKKFIEKVGSKDEPLIWGFKANPGIQGELADRIADLIDGKKVVGTKILHEQAPMNGSKTPLLKSIRKQHIVYIPNADLWNQDVLLRVSFQSSESGCKALLGFSDPSRLSMGIYQFLVSQQISDSYNLSGWAVKEGANKFLI